MRYRFVPRLNFLPILFPQWASAQLVAVEISTEQRQIPVLKYKENNPVLKIAISGGIKLDRGTHYFWVSYQVDEQANLLHFVDASLIGVTFQEGKKEPATEGNDTYAKIHTSSRNAQALQRNVLPILPLARRTMR